MAMLPAPILTAQDKQRFWHHVDKSGDCWIWMGSRWKPGYGQFLIQRDSKRIRYRAHRISYLIHHGQFPDNLVLHCCDNPSCVRPDHLFSGTSADNMEDKAKKGRAISGLKLKPWRAAKGERNGNALLTPEAAREIKRRYYWKGAQRSNAVALASEFGISRSTVLAIARGRTWQHVVVAEDGGDSIDRAPL